MVRLHAQTPDVIDANAQRSFVCPTLIDVWMRFLHGIRPTIRPERRIAERQRRNIGHRLQSLEFDTALLLHDLETRRLLGNATLHETVMRLKIHQCCVTVHSVLEGIGSHLVRVSDGVRNGGQIGDNTRIGAPRWRKALSIEVTAGQQDHNLSRREIRERLEQLTSWRDRIHLDRIDPNEALHFNEFGYNECFIPTYQTARLVLNALNPNWPDATCLNEDIQIAEAA